MEIEIADLEECRKVNSMLKQRVLVALLLLPIGITAIMAGGIWFFLLAAVMLLLAAHEYVQLFRAGKLEAAGNFVLLAILIILGLRSQFGFEWDYLMLPLILMFALAIHLFHFERGRDQAGSDFAITISAIFYIGLLGAFMISIRKLPEGQWWLLLVLFSVWLADSAAFFVGRKYGKNKMAPILSPNKSWQGYVAGLFFATLIAPLFLILFESLGMPTKSYFSMGNAMLLGFFMSLLPTLGDLGVSMIKRQMSIKDSGTILPGHGGLLDRMDSWLWAFPLSYLLITQVFLK